MPADPPRADNIGGAKVSSSAPQGEDNGMGQPLAAATSLSTFTMPMFAKDGVFFPTVRAGSNVVIHLPNEMRLQPAQWAGDGGATYTSNDVDYQVIPYSGGGGDIVVHRKSISSPSDMQFGVRLPANTHLRQGDNAFLLETDPARVLTAVKRQRASLKNPPVKSLDFLDTLERQQLSLAVAELRRFADLI